MKQNPFSLYDFMGYFVPGAVLIYGLVILDALEGSSTESFSGRLVLILDGLPKLRLEGVILMLIASYAIGHVLSFASSILIERYSVWMYGYPSRNLLDMNSKTMLDIFLSHSWYGKVRMIILTLFILPIVVSDLLLGKVLKFEKFYSRPLDPNLIALVKLKTNRMLEKLIGIKKAEAKPPSNNCEDYSDFFRIIQHYTFERSSHHQSKFTNYVALYGFLRTATLISVISIWYILYLAFTNGGFSWNIAFALGILLIVGYTFFMGYMKFYRRYTLEGLMVLVVNEGDR